MRPEPDQARSWLEEELARPEYHQESLTDRLLGWLGDLWEWLSQSALGATPLSTATAIFVLVVLAILVAVAASRVRREPVRRVRGVGVLAGQGITPDEHRASALQALQQGHYDVALVEAFRAVAGRAVDRGIVEDRPGLTAHELAAELGPAFPPQADALSRAAVLFDVVFYGDQPAADSDARSVLDLDEALRAARPTAVVPG